MWKGILMTAPLLMGLLFAACDKVENFLPKNSPATNQSSLRSPEPQTSIIISSASKPVKQDQVKCDDWTIIPKVCVGSITLNSSEFDLIAMFGQANVKNKDIYIGEGFSITGTLLFPDESGKELEIVWVDEEHLQIAGIHIIGSKWHTKEGIHIGTTLKELEKINGSTFTLLGFRWDAEGSVVSYNNGKLEADHQNLRLAFGDPGYGVGVNNITEDEYNSINGDREYPSSNPVLQKTNPNVNRMIVVWRSYDYSQETRK